MCKAIFQTEEKSYFCLFFLAHQSHVHSNTLPPLSKKEIIRLLMESIQQLSLASRQVKGQAACHTFTASPLGKESQSISAQEMIILISNLPRFPLPILPASIIIRQLHIKNVINHYSGEKEQVIPNMPTMFENLSILSIIVTAINFNI